MTIRTNLTLALLVLLAAGCDQQLGLNPDTAYVPDAPAEEVQDEEVEEEQNEEVQEEIEEEEEEVEDEQIEEEALEADADSDTFDDPLFAFTFLGSGADDLVTVADAVSAPFGDPNDWVAFTTPAPENDGVNVTIELVCDSDDVRAQLWEDGNSPFDLGDSFAVRCGQVRTVRLDVASDYLVRAEFPYGTDAQQLVDWELTVAW